MAPAERLYERAAPGPAGAALGPLWHLDGERTCFIGPLTYNAPHQHGAPVFLVGLYGRFGLRLAGGAWHWVRTAMVPAGVVHELDIGGDPIGVLYIEPTLEGAHALAALASRATETEGVLVAGGGHFTLMRELWEDAGSVAWASEALDELIGFGARRARQPLDRRIARVLARLRDGADDTPGVAAACAGVGLSPHHFQHLFTREAGVPYRRYRAWGRMRRAIAAVAQGSSLTHAAHEAGFCDQAHFTHDFRRTFGAPPSWSLQGVRMSGDPARRKAAAQLSQSPARRKPAAPV
ncbi:AraC-like DNA-binding protein [Ancylobacter aquaticus]|uniref:AraC-like DNA-binding protein n=1 Tax=Ancylobacter aquaticus TaxID=100 RepID=A0A4V2PGF7_ANCAQ|nr:AraC family transcriptional regulator [Ancylobacter aquaticus]TCK16626.1 AraC-like DNA-binding protein [Ancylobacter aquaticus]